MSIRKYFGIGVLVLCCATTGECQTATEKMKQMEWLLGNWNRTNAKPGRGGIERWEVSRDGGWSGRGIGLLGKDTVFVEKIRIAIENDRLYYIADVPENKKPVYFEIVEVTANSFTCENPQHDFPKKIYYRLEGAKLFARVSDGDNGVDYWFERLSN